VEIHSFLPACAAGLYSVHGAECVATSTTVLYGSSSRVLLSLVCSDVVLFLPCVSDS
jgi:hypothetical protein